MSFQDYIYSCAICGTDFSKLENIETLYHWYDIKNISFCTGCWHTLDICICFKAARISLEDIPLIISSLKEGDPLIILKYRLKHGIESMASFEDYPVLDSEGEKFKEIAAFVSKVLGREIEFKKLESLGPFQR